MAEDEEKYLALRRRNNIAVRKSRKKLREKQAELVKMLDSLQDENSNLQNMVSSRIRELNLLNSLLKQVGHESHKNSDKLIAAYQMQQKEKIFPDESSSTLNIREETSESCQFTDDSPPDAVLWSSVALQSKRP